MSREHLNGNRSCGSNIPGQQLINAVNWMIGNAHQDVAQICFRVESVQFGRADQAVHGCSTFSASIGAREQVVLPSDRNSAQRTLRCIVVNLEQTVIAIALQSTPAAQCIANRASDVRLARHFCKRLLHPVMQAGDQRNCPSLANALPLIRRTAADVILHSVEFGDSFQGFSGERRCMRLFDVEELAADVPSRRLP